MADANIRAVITAKDDASGVVKGFSGALDSAKAGSFALLGGLVAVGLGLASTVKSFEESQNIAAQLDAVLQSTGHAAGFTRDAAIDLSKALERQTTFSDEAVLSVENLLLTFTSIGKDIMPQTTKVVLDMATALGEDTKSAAIQVGKALQDPVLGITALRRVGVNFNDSQKEVIKNLVDTGKSAQAQQLILQELNKEFGGSAQAAAGTFAGRIQQLGNEFDDLKELIGEAIVKALKPFLDDLQAWIDKSGGVDGIMNNLKDTLSKLVPWIPVFAGAIITGLIPAFAGLFSFLGLLNPAFLAFVAVGAILGLAFKLLTDHFGGLGNTIKAAQPIVDAMKQGWHDLGVIFQNFIAPILDNIKVSFIAMLPQLQKLWTAISPILIPALKELGLVLGGAVLLAIVTFLGFVDLMINIINVVAQVSSAVWPVVVGAFNTISSAAGRMSDWIGSHIGSIIGFFLELGARVLATAVGFPSLLYDAGRSLIQGLINGLGSMAGAIGNKIKDIANSVVNTAKSILNIHSPSGVFADIGTNIGAGLIQGLDGMQDKVSGAVGDLVPTSIGITGSVTTQPIPQPTSVGRSASPINITINAQALLGNEVEARKFAQTIVDNIHRIASSKNTTAAGLLGMP